MSSTFQPAHLMSPPVAQVLIDVTLGEVTASSAEVSATVPIVLVNFRTPQGTRFARADLDKCVLLDDVGYKLPRDRVRMLCAAISEARDNLRGDGSTL